MTRLFSEAGHAILDIKQLDEFCTNGSLFDEIVRNDTLSNIISQYNEIVSMVETDPSLRIEFDTK